MIESRRHRTLLGIVSALLTALLCSNNLHAAQYIIDPARSEIVVQLFKSGVGSAFAHDHVVRAAKYSGQIQLDAAAPTSAQISVEIDAAALVADEPAARQKYQLPLNLGDDQRREIQQTLESEAQLHVQRYPKIRFRSTRVSQEREGQFTVSGELELRGATRTISLSVQAGLQNDVLRARGSARFLQSSFGYKPYSAFLGAVQNKDEVLLHLDITAVRQ